MADENLDMESVRISELDQTTEVDREKDYLVVSRHSDAYIDDEKSFKITPDDLLDGVGVNYNAGAHIAIDNNTHTISATYTNATTSADGLMSKEDKSTVDSLKPVATSGDYNDLTNKPTIPAAQVNSDWNSNSGVSEILNKPTLATVATTGDYADLSNTPTIPDAISDLTDDVSITNPENDEVLKYDATSSKWINAAAPAGASALSDLTDVTISAPLNNQALLYDNTTHAWINKAVEGTVPVKDTASGAIATFETNMADVLQEVKCEINATGGNGTPDNPNPINGFTEANIVNTQNESIADLFSIDSDFRGTVAFNQIASVRDSSSVNGITATRNNDNSWNISGTASADAVINLNNEDINYFDLYNDHVYFIAGTFTGGSNSTYAYGIGGLLLDFGGGTVWKNTNHYVRGFSGFVVKSGVTVSLTNVFFRIHDLTAMFGSTIADYIYSLEQATAGAGVAFFRSIYPADYYEYDVGTNELVGKIIPNATIAFGQTVYGGVLDVTSGKLRVTWIGDTINNMPFQYWAGGVVFYANLTDKKNGNTNVISDIFETLQNGGYGELSDGQIVGRSDGNTVYIKDTAYTDVYAFKSARGNSLIVYELATPFDIDLTPVQIEALFGVNNVWHDGNGNTEVKYYTSTAKDIKDFIETSIDVDDLADVDITTPSEGQTLVYDSANSKWINSTGGGGGGASDLNDLDDVTITTPSENQVLKYNGTQWVNATSPAGATNLDGLTDVTITTPTAGQALVYNGTSGEWENKAVDYANIANKPTLSTVATSGSYTDLSNTPTIPAAQVNADWDSTSGVSEILNKPTIPTVNDATITVVQGSTTKGTFTLNQGIDATITLDAGGSGGASALDDLTDVDITTPTDGQTLIYDSTNSKWVNGAGGGGSAKQTAVTQAQYDALVQAGTVDPTMEYFITDGIPNQVFPWTELIATLTAGLVSLVFTNSAITTNSTVDIYVDDSFYGVNPISVTLANGSLTLIFSAQNNDMPVKVRIS